MSWKDLSGENGGAKRGRTETSPPILRPVTPAGAKLGDWMKEIEAKMNRFESQIEGIIRSREVEALSNRLFRETQESKLVELDKKFSQIIGRLDKIQDDAKATEDFLQTEFEGFHDTKDKLVEIEETYEKISKQGHRCADFQQKTKKETAERDKKIADFSSSVSERDQKIADISRSVLELKVTGRLEIEGQVKKNRKDVEAVRKEFKDKVKEAAKLAGEQAKSTFKKTAANGIFFTGLTQIRKKEKLDGDITTVIHNILLKVGSSPYYTDVIAIHPKNSP